MSRPPSPSQTIRNPTERWEQIRSAWLTPSTSSSTAPESNSTSTNDDHDHDSSAPPIKTRRTAKDAVFAQRIKTLEQMLRAANSGESSIPGSGVPPLLQTPASPTLSNGKGKEKELEMEEPDDGFAVGGEKKGSTQELKKISEGIFLAFKQGRALKEALPLSLVTSLLFRSWLIDGTIPRGYSCATAEPDPPMPVPLSQSISQFPSHLAPSIPPFTESHPQKITELSEAPKGPSPLDMLSELNPKAVTPLPSGTEEGNFTGETEEVVGSGLNGIVEESGGVETGGTNTPDSFSTARQDELDLESMPPPPLPHLLNKKPALQPLQSSEGGTGGSSASLEGMGADETSGKLKLDVLRGSRWRTERDVASGSDII
ncbi:hypothetical protein JCM3765_006804 [Sporobolomyces pararoseus]